MKINVVVEWYERKKDWSPDYDKRYHTTIRGETPSECMQQVKALKYNHDVVKYTRAEIVYIY